MIQITNKSQYIELQVVAEGGGNWITEATPTNFHNFWTRKMIKSESEIEDYMEVTEKEKAALEAQDAAWEEPDAALIDRWHLAWFGGRWGARYNERTGFFEADGENAITTSQARRILDIGYIRHANKVDTNATPHRHIYGLPIILPVMLNGLNSNGVLGCVNVDTVRIINYYEASNNSSKATYIIKSQDTRDTFYLSNIKRVHGIFDLESDASYMRHFYNCAFRKLEELWIQNLNKGISLVNAENFRLDCLRYMIDYAMTMEAGQEIKIHSNLFNRITDESDTEAHELLALAQAKNITLTTL